MSKLDEWGKHTNPFASGSTTIKDALTIFAPAADPLRPIEWIPKHLAVEREDFLIRRVEELEAQLKALRETVIQKSAEAGNDAGLAAKYLTEIAAKARECKNSASPGTTLCDFWNALSSWSQQAFGSDAERGPIGPLKHLRKEVDEVLAAPTDLEEYVDCQFLVFDAARRAGFTFQELLEGCWCKLAINKGREWRKSSSDEPCEHVRS